MNSTENTFKRNLELFGPLGVLCAAFVLLMKNSSENGLLFFLAVIGLTLCWQWRIWGLCIASAALLGFAIFHTETLWEGGILFSLGLSFLVTSLCQNETLTSDVEQVPLAQLKELQVTLQEAQEQWTHDKESLIHKNKKDLEEAVQNANELWQTERNALLQKNEKAIQEAIQSANEQGLTERNALLQKNQKAIQDAIQNANDQWQTERNTLLQKNQKAIQDAIQTAIEQGRTERNALLQKNEKAIQDATQNANDQWQTERNALLQKNKIQGEYFEQATNKLQKTLNENQDLKNLAAEHNDVINGLIKDIEALKNQISTLQLKLDANRKARRNEGMFNQLQQQFKEKSLTLDATRQELFKTQEELLAMQRKWSETALFDRKEEDSAIERHLSQLEKTNSQLRTEHAEEVESLHNLITAIFKA